MTMLLISCIIFVLTLISSAISYYEAEDDVKAAIQGPILACVVIQLLILAGLGSTIFLTNF